MKNLQLITQNAIIAMVMQQMIVQQQLLEAQQKIIELQQRIDQLTPKNPSDKEVFWHVASEGVLSNEAANSNNVKEVKRFLDWNVQFAQKFVKPYVSPTVYSECLNQMTRGLPERIAKLETQSSSKKETKSGKPDNSSRVIQLPLLKDAL